MATPADSFRRLADSIRSIPADFGLREHAVTLVRLQYTGDEIGQGQRITCETPILVNGANPKVRFPSQKEIALGLMSMGSCTVGPFTPHFGDGGFSREELGGPDLIDNDQLTVRITGPQCPSGVLYSISNANLDRALRVTLTLRPLGNE